MAGASGSNSSSAELLWGAEKSQQCNKYFLQYRTFPSGRPQVRTWVAKLAFCPGRHLISLHFCIASLQISSIPFHFVLRELLYQTKCCSSLNVKIFGTSKKLDWLRHWLCFLHLAMIQNYTYLYSSN